MSEPRLGEGGLIAAPEASAPLYDRVVGARIRAALIDAVPLTILMLGMARQFGDFSSGGGATVGLYGWSFLGYLVLVFGYFAVAESVAWTSPGKAVVGLIAIPEDAGATIDMKHSLLRNLLRFVDWMPLFYLVGIIAVAVSPKDQRLGDMAAKTIVVRRRQYEFRDTSLAYERAQRRRWVPGLIAALTIVAGVAGLAFGTPAQATPDDVSAFMDEVIDEAFRTGDFGALAERSWDDLADDPAYEDAFNGHIADLGFVQDGYSVERNFVGEIRLGPEVVKAYESVFVVRYTSGIGYLRLTVTAEADGYVVIGWAGWPPSR